jgi:hypothetical protein
MHTPAQSTPPPPPTPPNINQAFENAITLVMATGGSTNAVSLRNQSAMLLAQQTSHAGWKHADFKTHGEL